MRDPNLASTLFVRDRVLSREILFNTNDFASLHQAVLDGESALFSASGRLTLTLPVPAEDLSRFNRLSLIARNCAHETLLVGMKLLRHSCSGPAGPGPSFSGGREALRPGGTWTTLLFPREAFGTYGTTTDWVHLEAIELTFGYERTHQGPAEIKVEIMALYGECRELPSGPRLTPSGLLKELRLQPDVLCNTMDAAIAPPGAQAKCTSSQIHMRFRRSTPRCRGGFYTRPKQHRSERVGINPAPYKALCMPEFATVRGKRSTNEEQRWGARKAARENGLRVPPPHPYPRETTEEILAGRIMGQDLGEPIPWNANPLAVQEWTHFLNRHHFMRTLVIALVETSDPRYAAALDRHIASWIADNPVPLDSNGGAGPTWETLTAAWRLREWVWVRRCAWSCAGLSSGTRELMLRSVWEHAQHLKDHQGHPNNWIMVESAALALSGIWFPEFRDADLWVKTGMERLSTEFRRQFFPDGAHFEVSPLYHAICVHAMLDARQSARDRDLTLSEEFDWPLERSFAYLAALCRPDFTWPSLNDGGSSDSDYTELLVMAGEAFFRPDLLWLGTRGKRGAPPETTFHVFPDAGIAAMRSGYTTDANFLVFRAGPAGAAHVHDDVLAVDVTALGVPRLVDPGITTYAPDALSDYYRSARAHNTILVDGTGPDRATLPFHQRIAPPLGKFSWLSGDSFQAVFGMYQRDCCDTREPLCVHRSVVFIEGEYWVLRDAVLGNGEHEIATCWQFSPARLEVDQGTGRTRIVDPRGPQFELIPVRWSNDWHIDALVGSSSPVTGWTSVGGRDVPSFSVVYRTRVQVPFVQEWILFPVRGRPHAGIEVVRSDGPGESTDLRISFPDGRRDLVTLGTCTGAGRILNPSVGIEIVRECSRQGEALFAKT
jgi:hypothetical protein